LIAYVVYDLRIADALEFRQSLWVGFGVAVAALAAIVANVLVAADPTWVWLRPWLQAVTLFVPVCAVLAIVRYDLFDINRLISASASYTLVIGLAAGTFVLLVPYAASAATEVLGTRAAFAQAFLSVTLGLVAVQGGRWLHPLLDGWFFPERRALEVGVRRILGTISGHQTAEELAVHVVEPLYELLRPESFVLYVRVGEGYAPVLVRGGVSAPIFESDHPVIFTLKERREPLAKRSRARRRLEKESSPIERAVLETVGASVLVPLHGPDGLFGFTCIGPKRSGDIYTATDLTLLNAVAERVESALLYHGEAERSREGRALQDRLIEYVPKEVADRLQRGEEMRPIHQELSVLFVDIRGYVALSQSRSPEEVFELLNAYTSAVSNVVRGNGGTVVEFRGDGLLAAFGAPEEMAEKEAAAVVAGREILALVASARFGDLRPGDLRVGVGVATGDAYVGSLESAGQKVWSVLGYIVNLAARLEALTRTLPAAMVIDESTRAPLGETTASGFRRRPSTQIKGNREPITVHALPLSDEVSLRVA
jgi:class 3 adenylate cyclase